MPTAFALTSEMTRQAKIERRSAQHHPDAMDNQSNILLPIVDFVG
jgi:hypothetical protein